jgi:hypothetical protein
MGKRLLKLPRRLFGYQASSVDQLIADRDSMLGVADQRVRSAEARIAELEEELSRRDEDIEAVKARLGPSEDPAPAGPASIERAQDSDEADLVPAALDDNEADEVEEWPVPIIRPRTVEFTPPPEPSADFDPMPIGGEDNEWSSPAGASAWAPEDEGTTDEPAAHADPWPSVDQAQGESWAALEDMVPAYEAPAEPAFEEHAEPAYEEHADAEDIPELPEHEAEPLAEPSPDPVVPQMTPAYMSEELAHVVKAAEESATKIIERAWESTRTQIEQVDRLWREIQEEIIRFAAWRQHVDPMISTVQRYIEEARASIEQVPPRIQEALSPAAEAMARVDEGMSEFARASDLPQLLGKMHAEVAKTMDTGDFTGSTSETSAADESGFHASDEQPAGAGNEDALETSEPARADDHEEPASEEPGSNHQAPSNGGPRVSEGEDMDMARAIAHELRIINESGDPITSPD